MEYIRQRLMKRSASSLAVETLPAPARSRRAAPLDEDALREIEETWSAGLTSRQIVDLLASRGIPFSEATLRKYVQLGLLPRSVRVGRKGKHRGSCGVYPAGVIRRVNLVRQMMAEDHTIEEIQRSFAKFQDDIDHIEAGLRDLIAGLEREAKGKGERKRRDLEREIEEARRAATELVRRIAGLERRLSTPADEAGTAVGGGSDLY